MEPFRLSLAETAHLLNYKSVKSAIRFCRNNQVPVFKDPGTRKKYVLKADLDLARLRATISHLRDRYGEDHWQSALKAHLDNDLLGLLMILQFTTPGVSSQSKKGTQVEKFLTELNAAISGAEYSNAG